MRNVPLQLPDVNNGLDTPKAKPVTVRPVPSNQRNGSDRRDFNEILYGGAGADSPFLPPFATQTEGLSVEAAVVRQQIVGIPTPHLPRLRDDWIQAGARVHHSPRTLTQRKIYSDKLIWYVHQHEFVDVGLTELEGFFDHLAYGHLEPGGRFGYAERDPRALAELRPSTVVTYHAYLSGFWTWLEKRGYILDNPFKILEKPTYQYDQVQPFTEDQFLSMMQACRSMANPQRNEALLLFLLDTGLRKTEATQIKLADVDFSQEETLRVRVLGKGNKYRTLRLSKSASQAMWSYFKTEHGLERFYKNRTASRRRKVDSRSPLFMSAHRAMVGEPLTPSGLYQVIKDICAVASIGAVRCSPHTIRHTFAITFLRNGGDIFTLRDMLGHTSMKMVERYLAIAQADIELQHARYSPADSLMRRR
ncbi:MAG: hypothetical protein EOP09_06630 [Proteobacteria bacterium]|nr:MAG: hypothetical protein EOP09_06630 [Pseudomonadota bacterium]